MGERAAAAAADVSNRPQSDAQQRLGSLLRDLQEADFVAVDASSEVTRVPPGSLFLVLGGSEDRRPFDVADLSLSLVSAMSERGAPVLAAEPLFSDWGLVSAIRDDGQASSRVSTVDQAETVEGRIAIVLGLRRQLEGTTDHYGVTDGATRIIPEPPPRN